MIPIFLSFFQYIIFLKENSRAHEANPLLRQTREPKPATLHGAMAQSVTRCSDSELLSPRAVTGVSFVGECVCVCVKVNVERVLIFTKIVDGQVADAARVGGCDVETL